MSGGTRKFITHFSITILILSSWLVLRGTDSGVENNEKNTDDNILLNDNCNRTCNRATQLSRAPSGVVGPLELLKNSGFTNADDWNLYHAYNPKLNLNHTLTLYNSQLECIQFLSYDDIDPIETPFNSNPIRARINQTFCKPCWTTSEDSQIMIFKFDCLIKNFIGDIDGSAVIFGEFYLEIQNCTSGQLARWPLVAEKNFIKYNGGRIVTGDSREGRWYYGISQDVGVPPVDYSQFKFNPPGLYNLSLIFQLYTDTKATGPNIITFYNISVDNVSLIANDAYPPKIVNQNNNYTFGPYNDDTYDYETSGRIDIDFIGDTIFVDTPLKLGKYRLNNSGHWHKIFKTNEEHNYLENWSIAGEWKNMTEGSNTIDIYCSDQVGNFNDTVKIKVIKDTVSPKLEFVSPTTEFITDEVELTVLTSEDTVNVKFYYWLDMDGDGNADQDDVNSTWVLLGELTGPNEQNNWSITWDTKNYFIYPEFNNAERKVIIKAEATDLAGNYNEVLKPVEVDNKPPSVIITNPEHNSAENGLYMYINYTTDADVKFINLYYRIHQKEIKWTLIAKDVVHEYGKTNGSYKWDIPQSLRVQKPKIEIKLEAIDKVGNEGNKTVSIGINWVFYHPLVILPDKITWYEDFGNITLNIRHYKNDYYSDKKFMNLKCYFTRNSENIFKIKGGNITGIENWVFQFVCIPDKFGTEKLLFYIADPMGFEEIYFLSFEVLAVNDPPELNLPTERFQVTAGEKDIFDLSIYIKDVDNKLSDLSLSTSNHRYVSTNGLELIFIYPINLVDQNKTLEITVNDLENSTTGKLNILTTTNHRPRLIRALPKKIEILEGVEKKDVLDLDNYISDPDGETLIYTFKSEMIQVKINNYNSISLFAKENTHGLETILIHACDPHGAFLDVGLVVEILYMNDPPRIRNIPDIHVHYYTWGVSIYQGYGYDFSYFIFDPDNDRSELKIRAVPMETELYNLGTLVKNDPNNNMKLIFKLPFEIYEKYGSKPHPFILYVKDLDPQTQEAIKMFNITVIIDYWPVEYNKTIPDQYFRSDLGLNNAFNLWDHFHDQDGGTTFNILDSNNKISTNIDGNYNIDLFCTQKYWEGSEEIVIIAHDTMPEQYVYAIFNVYVTLPPMPEPLPKINIKSEPAKKVVIDLKDYLTDPDLLTAGLIIETDDPIHVMVDGTKLIINYEKSGSYIVRYWLKNENGSFNTSGEIVIEIEPVPIKKSDVDNFGYILMTIIGTAIVLILIFLLFLNLKKRKIENKKKSDQNLSAQPPYNNISAKPQAPKSKDPL